jgi:hypothetical protein
MTQEQLNNYFEINAKVLRMTNLINSFELSYFQEKMQEKIIAPLLDDGFQQDDVELFFQVLITAAFADQKVE